MATLEVQARKTRADFELLPIGPPHFEFEEGEVIPMPSPTAEHQDVVDALVYPLRQYVRETQAGRVFREVDVYLPEGRIYIPDLSFLATEHLSLLDPLDRKIHGAPDLVVEVLSLNEARDRIHKFQIYYRNGVTWYWIVNPESLTIEEYQATPTGYQFVSQTEAEEDFCPQLFPNLTLNLATLLGMV